jgi:aquaporin Z
LPLMTDRGQQSRIEARRLVAEAIGTFALTLVACSTEVVPAVLGRPKDDLVTAFAPGFTVLAMICALGNVSGAHINPAVTLAFALRRAFPWKRVPGYLVAQLLGATAAALLLRAFAGLTGNLGVNVPHVTVPTALAVEALLTVLLVTVILSVSSRESLTGTAAAVPVGLTIALDGLVAGPLTGASMNPARSLGPVIAGGPGEHVWLYVVGPLLGALVAVAIVYAVHGRYSEAEAKDAEGESTRREERGGDESS